MDELLAAQVAERPDLGRGFIEDYEGRIGYMGGFWVPPSLRGRVLDSIHLSGPYNHPGSGKMLKLLKRM